MPFFLSGRFFFLFAAASLALVPAYFAQYTSLFIPLGVDLVLIVAALVDFFSRPSPREVMVTRPLRYPPAVDRSNEITLEIANRADRAVAIIIRDDVPQTCRTELLPLELRISGGTHVRVAYHLTPSERGNAEFGDIHYWIRGALGLVWKHGIASARRTVKLYPGLALIERTRLKARPMSQHELVRPIRKRGAGTEFDSLREYVVGDDARLIHWGTTARKGKVIVRQNRVERGQTVFLVLDAGRMMTARVMGKTKFDHALDAALLLSYAALDVGDKVGIMVVARDVLCFLPPSSAQGYFGRILDATYALEPRIEEPRFGDALGVLTARLKKRSLVVVFTDLIDEKASLGLIRYSMGLRPRHVPLVVAMSDTELVALAEGVPDRERDLYRQGVAAEVLERRDRLLARLTAGRVLVADTPPDKISGAVLDRYLDVKARDLL